MQRLLLLLLLVTTSVCTIHATPQFEAYRKYRIECKYSTGGSVVLGSSHGSTAWLYYAVGSTDYDDSWWYITDNGNGQFTIQSAYNKEYMTYSAERVPNRAKGLILTSETDGDNSLWTFRSSDNGYFTVQSVSTPGQWFNLRTDGSYLLGTYNDTNGQNSYFAFYDEDGKQVTEGGSTVPENSFKNTQGITAEGEYWERTGLDEPVVYTTDKTDPVLYSILNLRTEKYIGTNDSRNYLTEVNSASERKQFYFYKSPEGNMQIYTADGRCVLTSYKQIYENFMGVLLNANNTYGNYWELAWGEVGELNGYTICKLDNRNTSGIVSDSEESFYNYWNDYNGSMVGLYDVDAGSTFVFTSSDIRHTEHLEGFGFNFGDPGTKPTIQLYKTVDSLRIANKQLVYDQTSRTYFCPLPTSLREGGDWTTTFTYKLKKAYANYSIQLNGQTADPETGAITLTAPDCEAPVTLTLLDADGDERGTTNLQFTYLPLVEVNVPSCNGNTYTTGSIRVTNGDMFGHDSLYIAAYRYRGATAQGYNKKAYAIKLRDEQGNSVDRSFFGLRSDNNWILDAMAVDRACMRNRVATDLWNDFSVEPYYKAYEGKALTGTRGRFVEVFLNGKYHGIYCMTEKLDRKQLKLKKFKSADVSLSGQDEVHGVLYKSSDWSYEVFMGHELNSKEFPLESPEEYSNTLGKETWAAYELKYPDYETEAVDWKPLYDAINFTATSSQAYFDLHLKEKFDYATLRDYYLFIDLLLATDNHGKNMFYYVYDKSSEYGNLLGCCPWDLDGTFGQRWNGSTYLTEDTTQDLDDFLWRYEHGQLTIFYKLNTSRLIPWKDDLSERYAELRRTHFAPENLSQRFTDYGELFADSRADSREEGRWSSYHKNLQQEISYTEDWVAHRIEALDEKYGYDPTTTTIDPTLAQNYLQVEGGKGYINVQSGKEQQVQIVDLTGRIIRTVNLNKGFNHIGGIGTGIYIVNGKKVAVE